MISHIKANFLFPCVTKCVNLFILLLFFVVVEINVSSLDELCKKAFSYRIQLEEKKRTISTLSPYHLGQDSKNLKFYFEVSFRPDVDQYIDFIIVYSKHTYILKIGTVLLDDTVLKQFSIFGYFLFPSSFFFNFHKCQ